MARLWLKWTAQWFLYLLWWAGYWTALLVVCLLTLLFVLPSSVAFWIPVGIALAAASLITAAALRNSVIAWREGSDWSGEHDAGRSVFVGVFSGPVLAAIVSAGLFNLLERFGIEPLDSEVFGTILLAGAWLGAFTWEAIGNERPKKELAVLLLVGGAVALIGVGIAVTLFAEPSNRFAATASLGVPLIWASLMFLIGAATALSKPHPMQNLIAADSISFTAQLYIGFPAGEQFTGRMIKGNRLLAQAVRPGSLRIDSVTSPDDESEFAGIPCDRYVSNGVRQCEVMEFMSEFVESESAPWISHITSRCGLPEAISVDVLFHEDPFYNFTEAGLDTRDGRSLRVFEREHDRSTVQRVKVDDKAGLPHSITMSVRQPNGRLVDVMRAEFMDWKLNPSIDASIFDPAPPTGMKEREPDPPWYDESIVPGSAPAPLEAVDLAGRPIRLSDYTGKVVLLDFFAVWCGPCTAEIPAIQQAYANYRDRGFEVIGISFDDENGIDRLQTFIRERGIDWPILCDGSGFRTPLATPYGINAVPFTLLIGRNGKIAHINLHGEDLIEAVGKMVR